MEVSYDAKKNRTDKRDHGLYLSQAVDFELDAAQWSIDDREDYGEERWIALGFLENRLHVLVFTLTETGFRAISLRRAETYEEKEYVG